MLGGGDTGQRAGEPVDEILGLVLVTCGQLRNPALGLLVLERRVADERHGMDLDVVVDDELHARQPNPVRGQAPPAERRRRIGEVEHDLGAGRRNSAEVEVFGLVVGNAFVDESFVAFRTGDSHHLLVMQDLRCVAGADDGGQAEFAANDGGVRRAATMIRDDRRRPLHDRYPIRVRRFGDQYGTVDEAADVAGAFDHAYSSGHHGIADAETRGDFASLILYPVSFQRAGLAP